MLKVRLGDKEVEGITQTYKEGYTIVEIPLVFAFAKGSLEIEAQYITYPAKEPVKESTFYFKFFDVIVEEKVDPCVEKN